MTHQKVAILCFSQTGYETGLRLRNVFWKKGCEVRLDGKSKYLADSIQESHTEWTGRQFEWADAVIFVCACGIAVRSIAPFIKSKKKDPAVLVVDECGKFVISLLSGHLGGANELTEEMAAVLDAVPVITTATDLHHTFAVDMLAKQNDCAIFPMETAKEISAALLAGETVGFYSDFPWEGRLPEGLQCCKEGEPAPKLGIAVSMRRDCAPFARTLHLVPRLAALGMGCRREKDAETILQRARETLQESGLFRDAVFVLASIDLKKEEQGLLALAEEWKIPFVTFTAQQLSEIEGTFSASSFVGTVTGVDNVCERSAVCASEGTLIQKKTGKDGVTAALAVKDWRIRFE